MQDFKFNLKPRIDRAFLALSIILAIALGLRLFRLGANDLWYDEVYSIAISDYYWRGWNPPFYFGILHYWIKLFGSSEFAVRFPSLLFGLSGVLCLFLLGKRLFNGRVGLYAAALMSLSPFHLWYAQEARPYTLAVFLSILATYYLYRFLSEGAIKPVIIFVLLSILGLYSDTTYYFIFLTAIQLFILVIWVKKKFFWNLFFIFCAIFLILSLRLEHFISKLNYVRGGFWIPVPDFKSLVITIENFNLGYNASAGLYWICNLIVLFILVSGFLVIRKRDDLRRNFIFLTALVFLPLVLIFSFSKIFFPVYLDRGLIIFSPYYYLLVGLALDCLLMGRIKHIVMSGFAAVLLIGACFYYQNIMPLGFSHHVGVHLKKPFKPVISFIKNNFSQGDMLMHTNSSSQKVFEFYFKEVPQNFLFASGAIDTNWNRPYKSASGSICVDDLDSVGAKRLWVVSSSWSRQGDFDDNSRIVNSELIKLYRPDLYFEFEGLRVYRYVKI